MKKYFVVILIVLFALFESSECGVSGGRGGSTYNLGSGKAGMYSRGNFMSGGDVPQGDRLEKSDAPKIPRTSGISTLGIISIIMLIILIGFGAYWGIICYPLFQQQDRSYAIMHPGSTNNTTPTISGEFEKLGNYSSRSTTPSKSHE